MAGFCLPLLLPDNAAPKAFAAINHFFITPSVLSALQAHLYPSVFPATFNPDFHFFPPPQSLPFDQHPSEPLLFSTFLFQLSHKGSVFLRASPHGGQEQSDPQISSNQHHISAGPLHSGWALTVQGKALAAHTGAAGNTDINKAQLRDFFSKSEPLTAPQNCSRIPRKALQISWIQKLPVSPQNLQEAALICSQN